MKIRTRLFLVFGVLFGLVFLGTFYVEEYFTKSSLVESEEYLKKEIVKSIESRREGLADYISDLLNQTENKVSRLANRLYDEKIINELNSKLSLATVMVADKWVDLAQVGDQAILFGEKRFRRAKLLSDNSIEVDGKRYVGIPMGDGYSALFTEEYVRSYQPPEIVEPVSIEMLEPYIGKIRLPSKKGSLERLAQNLSRKKEVTTFEKVESYDQFDLPGMSWALANILASNVAKPDGIMYGDRAVLTTDIFHGKIAVPDGENLQVITPQGIEDVFFGYTKGDITVAVRGIPLLSGVTRIKGGYSAFITQDRVVLSFSPSGKLTKDPVWHDLPVEQLLEKKSGLITIGNEGYFFIHMDPKGFEGFHFFLFIPKQAEFKLIDELDKDADMLIHTISSQVRYAFGGGFIILLFVLSGLSRRITRPITHLAGLTKEVAAGRLEEIEIPSFAEGRKDEVYTLYHSFFDMVKGLKEKERVRGILNKVVSPEIAEETLKGNIQLGGEEKEVTVLFADIRHFTSMTENMEPHDVISLINECMTKVSHIIDEYGGVIDKYVGDEVMALFGAPVQKADSPLKAVQCAKAIIKELSSWDRAPKIEMGIGIHTGLVVAGNMGAENRLNYTVLGSNVNLAARLCQVAAPMEILISESTNSVPHVSENISTSEKMAVELKGFTKPVRSYAVIS